MWSGVQSGSNSNGDRSGSSDSTIRVRETFPDSHWGGVRAAMSRALATSIFQVPKSD